ncbi:methylated-DNA--[protein]-cysteine S-methyltransferase [Comamonas terrae]|uniref:Methylated-DNA--[protein]-cysteine S-methyltransferase n=2 Tax=Comamonas terrae TaxID=673548 RepID=A0ABW5UTU4_9BURK
MNEPALHPKKADAMPATAQRLADPLSTVDADGLQQQITCCCRWLEAEDPPPALQELARRTGLSPWQLHRAFKRSTGLTPKAYAKARRGQNLRAALAPARSSSVTDAAYLSGYEASSSFYKDAPAMLGMAPGAFRRKGANQTIRFAVAECSLGSLLVASTARGVCSVLLGDDAQALVHDLQRRFAAAELVGGDARYEQTVAQVVALVEQPRVGLELPLDIQGTAFQQRVWQALQAIPAGQTISYSELAQRLGMPQAARAVANAVAANPIAVAVPCHRVVRNDGSLSGYRWGVERKRALLLREAQQAKARNS